jgi:hypothetical protein
VLKGSKKVHSLRRDCREVEDKMTNAERKPGSQGRRVDAGRGYRVNYFAKKHGLTKAQARTLMAKVGNDRRKLNAAATGWLMGSGMLLSTPAQRRFTIHCNSQAESRCTFKPVGFPSLKEAVSYVMQELPSDLRQHAWITSTTVHLSKYEDIEAYYLEYLVHAG